MAENEPTTPAVPQPPVSKPAITLVSKLLVGLFMAGVILTECAIAYFMMPTSEQVAAEAEARLAKRIKETADDVGGEPAAPESKAPPEIEVELGDYSITYQNGASMLRVDVSLAATLLEEDKSTFDSLFKEKEKRFSQMVNVEFRSSDRVDLIDPKLGLIRRRILEKSNALFGKRLVRDVVVSQISLIEQ
jgi:flagellar FliL protein